MKEDEALDISIEPLEKQPPAVCSREKASRRKSTLGLITGDEGLHTIKGPEYGSVSTPEHNGHSNLSRKVSPRRQRWQSVRQRTTERKVSAEVQMKQVYALAKELQKDQTKSKECRRTRYSTFPVAVKDSPTTKRNLSCGDTASVGNGLELAGAIPKAKQEDIANGFQETRF